MSKIKKSLICVLTFEVMGIKCLLPFLKESTVAVVSTCQRTSGKVCAVDASCWPQKALAVSFKGLAMIASMFVLIYLYVYVSICAVFQSLNLCIFYLLYCSYDCIVIIIIMQIFQGCGHTVKVCIDTEIFLQYYIV